MCTPRRSFVPQQMEEGQDALRLANMQFASLADELTEAQEALSAKEARGGGRRCVLGWAGLLLHGALLPCPAAA